MKSFLPFISLITVALAFVACAPTYSSISTVPNFDAKRYAGEWHEIGRLPNPFEKGLVAAKAIYETDSGGTIRILNEGLKANGEKKSIGGTAKPANNSDPGKLLVRFDRFPATLFIGDYWILDLNEEYTRALVGSPDQKFLWLLSKDPSDNRQDFTRQISKAKELGFDTENLIFNPKRITN